MQQVFEDVEPDTDTEMTPLGPHVRWAMLQPEGILLLELDSNDRRTMDQWVDFSAQKRREWDGETPIMVIVDATALQFAFSPYLMKKGADMMKINKKAETFIAWVVQKNFAGQLIKGMLGRGSGGGSRYFVCYERAEAIAWVRAEYQAFLERQAE